MTIDEKYGHPPLSEQVLAPMNAFPKALYDRLMEVLSEHAESWSEMEIDAYHADGIVHLRVTLDVDDRPVHLYLDEHGDTLLFNAHILLDFPVEASYFVLKYLYASTRHLTFCVAERTIPESREDGDRKPALRQVDVLYGYRFFEFEAFVSSAHELLPVLVSRLTKAEKELRAFLEVQPPVDGFAA